MACAHLICGGIGAGKTTYALKLARTLPALRFSVDEWMRALYLEDAPEPIDYAWALARTQRCERQILALCAERPDLDVVLDFGFLEAAHRERIRAACRDIGLTPQLHFLRVDAHIRWHRVSRRNAVQGESYAMVVTRGMFNFCERLLESPTEEELRGATIVDA